jgi:ABC-type sugar transport system ATPase subunit
MKNFIEVTQYKIDQKRMINIFRIMSFYQNVDYTGIFLDNPYSSFEAAETYEEIKSLIEKAQQ